MEDTAPTKMKARIEGIEFYLPVGVLKNSKLSEEFPEWSVDKIHSKTGILERRIAGDDEFASDLAVGAACKFFAGGIDPESIDALLYCTQSPDYYLPSTACLLQHRLGLRTDIAAFDYNLGCSGYIYGLGLAKALIASDQAKRVLLLTSDTYSKFVHPGDRSVRTLFGDAATATLIDASDALDMLGGPFVYGTDGRGAENLIVPSGGLRYPRKDNPEVTVDETGSRRSCNHLYMNGPEIFNFSLEVVPETVKVVLTKSKINLEQIDLFVFHQANSYMLDHLRKKIGVPIEKFVISMHNTGNTVSSTIPIALKMAVDSGQLRSGMKVMLVGFGVGYSWGGTIVEW